MSAASGVDQLIAIKSVILHRVRVPFVEPFRISNGTVAEKESILIELTTQEEVGLRGAESAAAVVGPGNCDRGRHHRRRVSRPRRGNASEARRRAWYLPLRFIGAAEPQADGPHQADGG